MTQLAFGVADGVAVPATDVADYRFDLTQAGTILSTQHFASKPNSVTFDVPAGTGFLITGAAYNAAGVVQGTLQTFGPFDNVVAMKVTVGPITMIVP